MFKNVNQETGQYLSELVFARLALAKVDEKAENSFKKIKLSDGQQEDDILSYASEVQEHSYLAGLRDGARLMMGLGVAVNE